MAVPRPPESIATSRLLLRMPRLSDAGPLFDSYAGDPDIPRYMTWIAHTNASETEAFLGACLSAWQAGSSFEFVIERLAEPGTPIGMIGCHPGPGRVNFGYVLARACWGKGFMAEALTALLNWSLAQPSIHRAQAFCDVENPASARVMEKAGMHFEGILRRYSLHPNISEAPRDCRMYAKVR